MKTTTKAIAEDAGRLARWGGWTRSELAGYLDRQLRPSGGNVEEIAELNQAILWADAVRNAGEI